MKIRWVFCLTMAGTVPAVSQQMEPDREVASERSDGNPMLRGYKDVVLLAGIGTEELLCLRGEVQFFRGLYATAAAGYSFVPYPTGYLLTAAREFNGGITWRWYNSKFTPIFRAGVGRAYWTASDNHPAGNLSELHTVHGDLYSLQFGVEYRNTDGGCVAAMVGGHWWDSGRIGKAERASIQFYGGFAF